jgi:hypothetical protein
MIVTESYKITRIELARLASLEYLRSFWWFVIAVPLFGVVSMIFGDGPMKMIGMMAILWPFSIPARSVVSTGKSSRLFSQGCHVEADPENVVFIGDYHGGKRLRYILKTWRIKEAKQVGELILLRTRIPGFLPIRADSFHSDADREAFLALVEDAVAARLDDINTKDSDAK